MSSDATLILGALTVVSGVVGVLFRALLSAKDYQIAFLERELGRSQQREEAWAQAARDSTAIAGEAVGEAREARRRPT